MCGGEFAPYHKRQRFCSETCQRAWWKKNREKAGKKHTFVCQQCGKMYRTTHLDRDTCCSRECGLAYSAKTALATRFEAEAVDKVCLSCGQRFKDWPSKPDYCSDECKERGVRLVCDVCGGTFFGILYAKYCSRECELESGRRRYEQYMTEKVGERAYVCLECGRSFEAPYGNKRRRFCSDACARRYHGRIHKKQRRALKKTNGAVERIDPLQVYERDGWICGICGKRVRRECEYPHPMSPSLDHIVPLAHNGAHTLSNVQLAHRKCNIEKRDSDGGQLRLGLALVGQVGVSVRGYGSQS